MKLYNNEEVLQMIEKCAEAKEKGSGAFKSEIIYQLDQNGTKDIGLVTIYKERMEQLAKHERSVERDIEVNKGFQLSYVAGLLNAWDFYQKNSMTEDQYLDAYCPQNWNRETLRHMLQKSYLERLGITGALSAAEISRYVESGDTGAPYESAFLADEEPEDPEIDKHVDEAEEFLKNLSKPE